MTSQTAAGQVRRRRSSAAATTASSPRRTSPRPASRSSCWSGSAHTGGAAVSADAVPRHAGPAVALLLPRQRCCPTRSSPTSASTSSCASRPVASYTPVHRDGTPLAACSSSAPRARRPPSRSASSPAPTAEYDAWRAFYAEVARLRRGRRPHAARAAAHRRARSATSSTPATWDDLVEQPLGHVDRGAVPRRHRARRRRHRRADRHLRRHERPVAGAEPLLPLPPDRQRHRRVAGAGRRHGRGHRRAGRRGPQRRRRRSSPAPASAASSPTATEATVTWHDGESSRTVEPATGCSPTSPPGCCRSCSARRPGERPEGSQLKINLLLDRLPRLRSGRAAEERLRGHPPRRRGLQPAPGRPTPRRPTGALPTPQPGELYCHSLTDPSILGPLAAQGMHTLTYFGRAHPGPGVRRRPGRPSATWRCERALDAIDEVSTSRSSRCSPRTQTARPCLEAKAPQDVEEALAMPGGHIFHGDLAWPWAPNRARLDTPAQRWGVATDAAERAAVRLGRAPGRCGQRPRRSQRGPGRAGLAPRPLTALPAAPPGAGTRSGQTLGVDRDDRACAWAAPTRRPARR